MNTILLKQKKHMKMILQIKIDNTPQYISG